MAYSRTQAAAALGTIVYLNTSDSGTGSPPTWTPIGEVTKTGQSGASTKSDDATNFSSQAEEFIPTIRTEGTWDCTMNRIPGDPGFQALQDWWYSVPPTTEQIRVQLPKAPGQTVVGDQLFFFAILEKFMPGSMEPTKKIPQECSFKITGPVVETPGN
jgi:hypothetical protein